jgi:ADP-ribose pyrophosphatase YjhB (NUDIX family)
VHELATQTGQITLTWVEHTDVAPARVYALASVSAEEMLLVSGGPHDPQRWLPGGGVEPGETLEQVLQRELKEEADAALVALVELGSQHADNLRAGQEYHRFYWCRMTLADQAFSRTESTLWHIV